MEAAGEDLILFFSKCKRQHDMKGVVNPHHKGNI